MKLLRVCITICVFVSCSRSNEIPENILPVNKMKVLVWDMIQAGAYESSLIENDSSLKKINTSYLSAVLSLHKIKKEDFFTSYNFYQQNPVRSKMLFDSVSAYAQRQRSVLYKSVQ